jgi:Flp pilus assembly protein TadD
MAETHTLLGGLLARRRDLAGAGKEYKEAIRLHPDFARLVLDLASAYAAQGDMQQTVQQLRQAAKSRDPEVARLAAAALQRLGEH